MNEERLDEEAFSGDRVITNNPIYLGIGFYKVKVGVGTVRVVIGEIRIKKYKFFYVRSSSEEVKRKKSNEQTQTR